VSLERDSFYSQPEWQVYRMRYTSLDGYRIFAWLSIPVGSGPFPSLLRMPDYGSVHDIIYTPLRRDAMVMNPTHRGQRHSDSTFQAQYPGLLTEGIDRPEKYIMRQVFADALRAVDALLGQSEAEVSALVLAGAGLGGSLALAAAARRPEVKAVAADTPLALGHPGVLEEAAVYPLGELQDYLRVYPHRREAVLTSSAPLDPLKIAPLVGAPVLLSLGRRDRGQCPIAIGEELANKLPQCDLRIYDGGSEGGGHEHSVIRGGWLRAQLGLG
jgi:cephalosporin-C deacetylase-like acetyl esterase